MKWSRMVALKFENGILQVDLRDKNLANEEAKKIATALMEATVLAT
jgi:hypothetical protein